MKELRGKAVSDAIGAEVRQRAAKAEAELGRKPKLLIVRCGEKPSDISYERSAVKKAKAFGLDAEAEVFPETVGETEFLRRFAELNADRGVDGILLLRPLPPQINEGFVLSSMDSQKDIDGAGPVSAAGLYLGAEGFAPCTAEAVMELLRFYEIPVEGKEVVILGRSEVVGKPLALLMLAAHATVTVCHSRTKNLGEICRRADILVPAIGKPRFVTGDFLKEGAVIVDVGMNEDENGVFCGDADHESCSKKASALAPVPGGLGAVTTAVLMRHVLEAAENNQFLL